MILLRSLIGLFLLLSLPCHLFAEPSYSLDVIDGHHCLVGDPAQMTAQTPLVLFLHGLGGSANNFLGAWESLGLPPCRVVYCDATLSLGGGFGWYRLPYADHWPDIADSRVYLLKVIDHYLAEMPGKGKRPVILIGFSQGGVMSLEAGLHYPGKLAAIVCMSGFLPHPEKTLENTVADHQTPILMIHGVQDDVTSITLARQAKAALMQKGYHPDLEELPMGHFVTPESLKVAKKFLETVFEGLKP